MTSAIVGRRLSVGPGASPVIHCGTSDRRWRAIPDLVGRHCILEAGHDGCHVSQRDDETFAETVRRCAQERDEQ